MTESHYPYKHIKTSDGRVFTAQPVHGELQRENVTVCATHEDAKRLALEHEAKLAARPQTLPLVVGGQ